MGRLLAAVIALGLVAAGAPARAERPEAAVGSYHITIFLPESDGSIDPNLEDWTDAMEAEVVDQVTQACMYWAEMAPDWAELSCHVSYFHYADTPTGYEPITREGGSTFLGFFGGDEGDWINEMMDVVGYSSMWRFYYQEVEDYNDAQREEHGTDGAFSAFVVNSEADEDGSFTNGMSAYVPEIRAPYLVMTWDNNGWRSHLGPEALRLVCAHEMCHIFGAHDEYAGSNSECSDESSGYSNANHESCPSGARTSCLMRQNQPCGIQYPYPLCYWTRGQVGWEPECEPSGICGLLGPEACASGDQCVDGSLFCDGQRDCDDATDELGCGSCGPHEYRCDNGECSPDWDYCECPDADGDRHRDAACGGDDCDDTTWGTHPGADEECNGVDDDCDGMIDEGFDADRDGYSTCSDPPDCNDHDPLVHPGAAERCGDGVDQDCVGGDQSCDCPDRDGDGLADHACGGQDCDDLDPANRRIWPDCESDPCAGGSCDPPEPYDSSGCGCSAPGPTGPANLLAVILALIFG